MESFATFDTICFSITMKITTTAQCLKITKNVISLQSALWVKNLTQKFEKDRKKPRKNEKSGIKYQKKLGKNSEEIE